MTAYEFLNQIPKLNIIIHQKQEELQELRENMTSINCIDCTKERVDGGRISSDAPYVEILIKIEALEKEIVDKIDECAHKKDQIINVIHELSDPKKIDVLYQHYVKGVSLQKIAKQKSLKIRAIQTIHKEGLEEFDKNFTELRKNALDNIT